MNNSKAYILNIHYENWSNQLWFENEDSIEVYVEPDDFYNVKDIFNKNDFEIFDAEIKLIANEKINELEEKIKTKLQEFIDSCDDDEDIQWVVTNYEEI